MAERWISIAECAASLGVNTKTVRRWITSGTIRANRIGPRLIRIDPKSLDNLGHPLQYAHGDS